RRSRRTGGRARLEGPARFVAPAPRADSDHRHALRSRDRHAGRAGIEAEERPDLDVDLLAVDAVLPGPGDDDVDLLLTALELVVLASFRVGGNLEPVDPERLDSEHAAD